MKTETLTVTMTRSRPVKDAKSEPALASEVLRSARDFALNPRSAVTEAAYKDAVTKWLANG